MQRQQRARIYWLLVSGVLTAAPLCAQTPPDNATCQTCHAEPSLTRSDGRPVIVRPEPFAASVHGSFNCVDCHADLAKTADFPHSERLTPVNCGSCHDEPAQGLKGSVHGGINTASGGPLQCMSCHGPPHEIKAASDFDAPTNRLKIAETCAKCHVGVAPSASTGVRAGPAVAGMFADSIHGRALASGLVVAPTCSDCHQSHAVVSPGDAASPVFPRNVPVTCGRCHAGIQREYSDSVHAAALGQGVPDAPHCASCHSAHQIAPTQGDVWQLSAVVECGTCHREALATYRDTFHGQVTALGFTPVAKCADCHRSHGIRRVSDPVSAVSSQNRLATCQSCHPSATPSFAQYEPHANKDDSSRLPALYYAARFMNVLLIGVFTFFGAHTLLWFTRERFGPDDHMKAKAQDE